MNDLGSSDVIRSSDVTRSVCCQSFLANGFAKLLSLFPPRTRASPLTSLQPCGQRLRLPLFTATLLRPPFFTAPTLFTAPTFAYLCAHLRPIWTIPTTTSWWPILVVPLPPNTMLAWKPWQPLWRTWRATFGPSSSLQRARRHVRSRQTHHRLRRRLRSQRLLPLRQIFMWASASVF